MIQRFDGLKYVQIPFFNDPTNPMIYSLWVELGDHGEYHIQYGDMSRVYQGYVMGYNGWILGM